MADNVTAEEVEDMISDFSESFGLSVKEFVEGGFLDLVTYGTDKDAILARLDAIDVVNADDDIDSIAERILAINEVLTSDADALTTLTDAIASINARAQTIEDTADVVRTDLDAVASSVTTLNGDADTAGSVAKSIADAVAPVSDKVDAAEAAIAVLNGDDQTEGSVAKAVLDATGGDIDALKDRVTATETEGTRLAGILDDEVDSDGNVTAKGVATRVTDAESEIAAKYAAAVAYVDETKLVVSDIDTLRLKNAGRVAMGLAELTE